MDNIIYIWVINRLLTLCHSATTLAGIASMISGCVYVFVTLGAMFDNEKEKFEMLKRKCRKPLISLVAATIIMGTLGSFRLDNVEFKTVVMYVIGKEIIQSDQGEKVISIIDQKLDEWNSKIK